MLRTLSCWPRSSVSTWSGKDEGYLVTFDFSKNKEEKEPEWIEWNGKRIFEAVI